MSTVSSPKTLYTASEASLGSSSALMTAASHCASSSRSDADFYETSSELLSARADSEEEGVQLLQGSKSSADLPIHEAAERLYEFASGARSDTCLSQQSRMISDFMEDVLSSAEPHSPAPGREDSTESVFYPAEDRNSSSPPNTSRSDVTLRDTESGRRVCKTVSQTKNRILENLAQVTYNKLFSKSSAIHGYYGPSNAYTEGDRYERPSAEARVPSQRSSQLSRRSTPGSRKNGVESILMIDYELQPLNLMLSKLLAEFRAMDLRGKLGFSDPSRPKLFQSQASLRRLCSVRSVADDDGQSNRSASLILDEYARRTGSAPSEEKVNREVTKASKLGESNGDDYNDNETELEKSASLPRAKASMEKCARCSRPRRSGTRNTNETGKPSRHRRECFARHLQLAQKVEASSEKGLPSEEVGKTSGAERKDESDRGCKALAGLAKLVEQCSLMTRRTSSARDVDVGELRDAENEFGRGVAEFAS